MPLTMKTAATLSSYEAPLVGDWIHDRDECLKKVETVGRKLVSERFDTKKGRGTSVALMTLEAQLIRTVARIFYLNERHNGSRYPSLSQWLLYVNLTPAEKNGVLERLETISGLIDLNDKQVVDLCNSLHFGVESRRRLRKSTYHLRRYCNRWNEDGIEPLRIFDDKDLGWMSHDFQQNRERSNPSETIVEPLDSCASDSGSALGSNVSQSSLATCSPPPSPAIILTTPSAVVKCLKAESFLSNRQTGTLPSDRMKQPNRAVSNNPPVPRITYAAHQAQAERKAQAVQLAQAQAAKGNASSGNRLCRSHSQDSLTHKTSQSSTASGNSNGPISTRNTPRAGERRANALSPHPHPQAPTYSNLSSRPTVETAPMPKSPGSARALHCIPHKWARRKVFLTMENCRVCQQQFKSFGSYEKCTSCKSKVHTRCKSRIGDNCGLTLDILKQAFNHMFTKDFEEDNWKNQSTAGFGLLTADSSYHYDSTADNSSSSAGSSTPSTPAYSNLHSVRSGGLSQIPPYCGKIPEAVPEVPDIVIETDNSDSPLRYLSSQGSDSTERGGGVTGSEGTLLTESYGNSQGYSMEKDDDQDVIRNHILCRDRWSNGTIRIPNNWSDVTIPLGQVQFKDASYANQKVPSEHSLLGRGRFGDVHKGQWFGDVAVKYLDMSFVEEVVRVEAFKQECAAYRNTRHVNIVLFMGCCFDVSSLYLVLDYCKGMTLHVLLHDYFQEFDFAQVVQFGVQICQGISYLHTKGILHKDLRSKNLFIEKNNRIVITDFGFFSMKRLYNRKGGYLKTPERWLTYLAPELIRHVSYDLRELPFSEKSDMYSFGTVWYELMTYQFPFLHEPTDSIIWKTGRGIRGGLQDIKASKQVKDILVRCWASIPSFRPTFVDLQKMIEDLPKKRLTRRPSYPLSRSHESMFV